MTIKEVEQTTGLTRSIIRFYEKEKLICPKRNENNGYLTIICFLVAAFLIGDLPAQIPV